jgi:HAD superfamily hydrolase (TIGR01458 family)
VDGVLLDIDGVLAVSWEPIPGAIETLEWLRSEGTPFRLITNTTTDTRAGLAERLGAGGFSLSADEIVTAVVATGTYLRKEHPGASVFLLTDGDPREDLKEIALTDTPEEADVMVLGGASEVFSYETVNRVFRRLKDGAPLVAMHRNLYWRTSEGWELDGGAYVTGLEEAAGVEATICGKPSREYFESALAMLGVGAARAAMVGDDILNDVMAARAAGLTGVLVRTGKFQPSDLEKGEPDAVLDSIADLPSWLRP